MNPNNPLKQYFRQPAIYVRLPSQGNFYPEGSIEMPVTNELPVYPMTAIDEITYRTPDALFNGQAVVNVIQSCVPNIKNGWNIPTTDVDTLLIAIRISSYGHEMEFSTQCPACNNVTDNVLDLRTVLDTIKSPDYNQSLNHGDIEIYFKPLSYKNLNDNNQLQYEGQKMLQMLPTDDDSQEVNNAKVAALGDALKKLTEITVQTLAQSVAVIRTPTAIVNQTEFISEFFTNCDRELFNQIRDHIIEIKKGTEIQPVHLKCPDCGNEYDQPMTLDMTSFFGVAS